MSMQMLRHRALLRSGTREERWVAVVVEEAELGDEEDDRDGDDEVRAFMGLSL